MKPYLLKNFFLIISLLFIFNPSISAYCQAKKSLTVLSTIDHIKSGLDKAIQYFLAKSLASLDLFSVSISQYKMEEFSMKTFEQVFTGLSSELLCFAILEKNKISILLFNSSRKDEYILVYQPLFYGKSSFPSNAYLSSQIKILLNELVSKYEKEHYQKQPNSISSPLSEREQKKEPNIQVDIEFRKYQNARRLYSELIKRNTENAFYIGAEIGTAKMGASNLSASTVSYGGFTGFQFFHNLSLELGINAFTFGILYSDFSKTYSILDKFISLTISVEIGRLIGKIADTEGASQQDFLAGGFLFGPNLKLEVPLLGTMIRGKFSYLIGSNKSIFLNTYGIVYPF